MGAKTLFFIVFSIVGCIYLLSSFPSVPGGDSGELLSDSCLKGTAHPPGYPTFLLLAQLWGNLPLKRVLLDNSWKMIVDNAPTVAWKINILCGVFGSVAAASIACTTRDILRVMDLDQFSHFVPATAAFLFALSPLVWEYSITAEVFALNNAILALALLCTVKILVQPISKRDVDDDAREARYLVAGALLSGLALSNQHASLIQLVVVIPFALLGSWKRLSILRCLLVTVAFAAGLSPYYYLVVASRTPAKGSWGDLTSLEGLARHVLRAEYGTFQLGVRAGAENALQRILAYCKFTSEESFHVIFPLLAICGAVCLRSCWDGKKTAADKKKSKTEPHPDSSSTEATGTATGTGTAASSRLRNRKEGSRVNSTPDKVASASTAASTSKHLVAVAVSDMASTSKLSSEAWRAIACVFITWIFYTVVWHSTLSNLPLSAPMAFAVHSRFWMQPNVPLAVLAGVGLAAVFRRIKNAFSDPWANSINPDSGKVPFVLELLLLLATVAVIVFMRFEDMDRSKLGWAMHRYANGTFTSLPRHSILLTHTDLDWNTARYLQSCQKTREDLRILSFQMMPYPWFQHQQRPLYPDINFPDTDFPGVSTDRAKEGNSRLILDFLAANYNDEVFTISEMDAAFLKVDVLQPEESLYHSGIFLDMQAVNEVDIGPGGQWKNHTLMPWGNVYRVLKEVPLANQVNLHALSYIRLRRYTSNFQPLNDQYFKKFYKGSWEFAAASVYYDAHYQLGLFLLTYSLELLKNVNLNDIVLVIDRLHLACSVLETAWTGAVERGAISSSVYDVQKNTAIAFMRIQGVLGVAVPYKHDVEKHFYNNRVVQRALIMEDIMDSLIVKRAYHDMCKKGIKYIESFIRDYPADKDTATFQNTVRHINNELQR